MTPNRQSPVIDKPMEPTMNLSNRSLLNKTFLADGVYSLAVGAVLILLPPRLLRSSAPPRQRR
ncbi:hypothetical protein ACU4I5_02520 [Ensifer adhaerens]